MQRDIVNDGGEEEEENETLKDEIIAINSIYGEDTIRSMITENDNNEKNIYILHLPHEEIWLKIQFAPRYPYCSNDDDEQQKEDEQKDVDEKSAPSLTAQPPIRVLGTHGCGPTVRKGDATRVCQAFQQFTRQLYRPGHVYLFDIMEELMNRGNSKENNENGNRNNNHHQHHHHHNVTHFQSHTSEDKLLPSDNLTEKSPFSNLLCEKENVNSIFTPTSSTAVATIGVEDVNYKKVKEKHKKENDLLYSFTHQQQQQHLKNLLQTPTWFISEPIRELKSLFLAHCTYIHSINDVTRFRNLLLEEEDSPLKKVASATHNIMAWRIRFLSSGNHKNDDNDKKDNDNFMTHPHLDNNPPKKNSKQKKIKHNKIGNNNSFAPPKLLSPSRIEEDYDDDGESAAGARLLHLMRLMNICNVLVIVSRWYGGVNLGPRRFALINSVARDAILKATTATTTTSNSDL